MNRRARWFAIGYGADDFERGDRFHVAGRVLVVESASAGELELRRRTAWERVADLVRAAWRWLWRPRRARR